MIDRRKVFFNSIFSYILPLFSSATALFAHPEFGAHEEKGCPHDCKEHERFVPLPKEEISEELEAESNE